MKTLLVQLTSSELVNLFKVTQEWEQSLDVCMAILPTAAASAMSDSPLGTRIEAMCLLGIDD